MRRLLVEIASGRFRGQIGYLGVVARIIGSVTVSNTID